MSALNPSSSLFLHCNLPCGCGRWKDTTCKGKEHPVRSRVMFSAKHCCPLPGRGDKKTCFPCLSEPFFALPAWLPSVDIIACQLYGVQEGLARLSASPSVLMKGEPAGEWEAAGPTAAIPLPAAREAGLFAKL